MASDDLMKKEELDKILRKHGDDPKKLDVILKEVLDKEGRLRASNIVRIAEVLKIPIGDAFTFTSPLSVRNGAAKAKNVLTICLGRNCVEAGAVKLLDASIDYLGIEPWETTEDHAFTLDTVVCMGYCDRSRPNVMINDQVHQGVSPDQLREIIRQVKSS